MKLDAAAHKWTGICRHVYVCIGVCMQVCVSVCWKDLLREALQYARIIKSRAKPHLPPSISPTAFRELSVTLSRTSAASRRARESSLLVRCRPSLHVIVSITMHRGYPTAVLNVWLCRVTSRRSYTSSQ